MLAKVNMGEHRNIIDLQRAIAFKIMGQRARALMLQGYEVEANRILDAMIERRQAAHMVELDTLRAW